MNNFEQAYLRLNNAQKQAVDTTEGPVMVVAGPGTGKTQMLALRITNIIAQTDTEAQNILCLTFTDAGVRAMRERLIRFIGNAAYKVAIHTFHSFANEIIQTNPEKFAFARELKQIDDLKRLKVLRGIIDTLTDETELDEIEEPKFKLDKLAPFHDKYYYVYMIQSAIQSLKKEAITPEELTKKVAELKEEHEANPTMWRGKVTSAWKTKLEKLEKLEELSLIYSSYQEELKTEGFYDYEDMIMFVIDKFSKDESLLLDYQERYLYVHVDEYQDTNGAQNEIIRLLGNFDASPNIFVVGDDDQAIYRFQGANLGNILFFAKHFEGVQMIPTTTNYRSTQLILDLAESLITNNKTRLVEEYKDLEKKLKQGIPSLESRKAEVWEFNNGEEEHIFIANEIKKLNNNGVSYNDIAVIYRKNAHGDELTNSLLKLNIPVKADVSKNVFESEYVQKLIHILNVVSLYDKNINENIYRMLLFDFLQIPTVEVYRFNDNARANKSSLIEEILKLSEAEYDSENKIAILAGQIVRWHKESVNVRLSVLVERILYDSELLQYVLDYGTEEESNKISAKDSAMFNEVLAINSFFNYVKIQEQINPDISLWSFLNDLKLVQENNLKISLPRVETEKDSVNLLTAHSSKGLEFEYVFIINATDNNWGNNRKQPSLLIPEIYADDTLGLDEKELGLEDERRLFFVAITRARQKVYFTYAKQYVTDGNTSNPSVTPFINDLKNDLYVFKSVDRNDVEFTQSEFATLLKPKDLTILGDLEKSYLKEKLVTFKLSPTALNTYLDSPEEFKEKYLLKVPEAKSKELALGTSIHYALEQLNKDLLNQPSDKLEYISLERFQGIFVNRLMDEYGRDDEFEITKEEGLEILEKYYQNYIASGQYKKPIEVEYNFGHHSVFLELENQAPVQLTGKIDKVEVIEDNLVKVIDYKTSKAKSENEIKGLTANSTGDIWRQLVFYKLMVDLDTQFRPNRKFTESKYEFGEAEVDFLRETRGKHVKRNFSITNEDVDGLKIIIGEVMKKIRNLEFPEKYSM